ncbi:glycosyltransferase [Neobacillus drentensis]|uniref:glycosyltransferase n=1 Tax=Neobacillus drentensis TaxID=220684 RepID=UPI002FFDDBB2
MELLFSVVIPVHNRAEQLLLTLTSFEKQINPLPFEVVVINDASTDHTVEVLKHYSAQAPYPFSFVSLENRQGPGAARNAGIQKAMGKYIIFCDADYLVLPNFIETHYHLHLKHENAVVSGTPYCYKGIYSLYFPSFSSWESSIMKQSLKRTGLWKNSYIKAAEITSVLTQEDIRNDFDKVYKILSINDGMDDSLRKEFYDLTVAPWLLFITRNVSVEKSAFEKIGQFDERLIRGSGEDWELGYRLYQNGYQFVIIEKEIGYHQEHPNEYRKPYKTLVSFSSLLAEKFGKEEPEIFLLSIWNSSDDLWKDIPIYKNMVRLFSDNTGDSNVEQMKYLLKKGCQKIM